jgi:hypothetical protein
MIGRDLRVVVNKRDAMTRAKIYKKIAVGLCRKGSMYGGIGNQGEQYRNQKVA